MLGSKNSKLGIFLTVFVPSLNLSAHSTMYAQLDSKTLIAAVGAS